MSEKSWNTPVLKIGEEITSTIRGFDLAISHVDRRVDPYLAAVIKSGKIIATGLCVDLPAARRFCAKFIQ